MVARRPGCTLSARAAACSNSGRQPSTDSAFGALHRKIGAGEMQLRQRLADRGAMPRVGPPDPHAVEEGDDRGRPAAQRAERLAGRGSSPAAGR